MFWLAQTPSSSSASPPSCNHGLQTVAVSLHQRVQILPLVLCFLLLVQPTGAFLSGIPTERSTMLTVNSMKLHLLQEPSSSSLSTFTSFMWLSDNSIGGDGTTTSDLLSPETLLSVPSSSSSSSSFSPSTSIPWNSIGETVQSIGLAITSIIFLGLGLAFLYASMIIPAAAKQLEQEAQELAPDLLQEYLDKLEDGQTLAQRPELMQELGSKITPLLEQKVARQQQQQQGVVPPTSSSSSINNDPEVVDVEVVSKKTSSISDDDENGTTKSPSN